MGVTPPSAWPWLDHLVSGLLPATECPIQTRFRCAYGYRLKLARHMKSLTHYTKGTPSPRSGAPTACRLPVSGTISLPLSGCFSPFPHGTSSLSVTREYLALGGGPPGFRPRFTAAVLLRNFDRQVSALSPTGRLPSMARGSTRLRLEPDLVTVAGSGTTRTRSPTTPARQRVPAFTWQV